VYYVFLEEMLNKLPKFVCADGGEEEEPGDHLDEVAFAKKGNRVATQEQGGDEVGGVEQEGGEKQMLVDRGLEGWRVGLLAVIGNW
jgi:hypothetical protein